MELSKELQVFLCMENFLMTINLEKYQLIKYYILAKLSIQLDPGMTHLTLVWINHVRSSFKFYIQSPIILEHHIYVAMSIFGQTTEAHFSLGVQRITTVHIGRQFIFIMRLFSHKICSLAPPTLAADNNVKMFRKIHVYLVLQIIAEMEVFVLIQMTAIHMRKASKACKEFL